MSSIDLDLIKAIDARINAKMTSYTDIGTVSSIEAGQVNVVFDGSQLAVPVNCGIGVLPFQFDRVGLVKFGSQWTIVTVIRGQDDYRGIPRFASKAARDAAITAPYVGLMCYTIDQGITWIYSSVSGGKWIWAWPQSRTEYTSLSSTTITYANAPELSISLEKNGNYVIHAWFAQLSAPASDFKVRFTFPNSNFSIGNNASDTNLGINLNSTRGTGNACGDFGFGGNGIDQSGWLGGDIQALADGDLVVQFAQWTGGASASWILYGSNFIISQVG